MASAPVRVVTVALQARDLSGRRRTDSLILSMAPGQGSLPPWLEAEIDSL